MENENGDAPADGQHAGAAQGLQDQVNYLQQQLLAQQNLFAQQQQFLQFQAQHLQAMYAGQHGNGQRPRAAEPQKIKLPSVWTNGIRSWFQLAESQFGTFAVDHPRQQFDIVVAALNDEARLHAKAVVENAGVYANPYVALRERLLAVYEPSVWEQSAKLLKFAELGDRRPSDQLDAMLALVPGDLSVLVKAIFLGSLPADMRDHVQQGAELLSYQQLAARADSIWQSRQASRAGVVAAVASPGENQEQVDVEHLEQVLAAVRFSKQPNQGSAKPGGNQGSHRGGKSSQGGQGGKQKQSSSLPLCTRHFQFGKRAHGCADPATCQFPKN